MQTIKQLEKIDLSKSKAFYYKEKKYSKTKYFHYFVIDGKKYVVFAPKKYANIILNNEDFKKDYKSYNFYYGEYENERFLLRSDQPQ
tara:strand:- start:1232 stop:1492 length:261 start_codon:yes stop_codon:yes gene_type:complete